MSDEATPSTPPITHPNVWQLVTPNTTDRLRVPGGWLYRTMLERGVAMTFVPDPLAERGA